MTNAETHVNCLIVLYFRKLRVVSAEEVRQKVAEEIDPTAASTIQVHDCGNAEYPRLYHHWRFDGIFSNVGVLHHPMSESYFSGLDEQGLPVCRGLKDYLSPSDGRYAEAFSAHHAFLYVDGLHHGQQDYPRNYMPNILRIAGHFIDEHTVLAELWTLTTVTSRMAILPSPANWASIRKGVWPQPAAPHLP